MLLHFLDAVGRVGSASTRAVPVLISSQMNSSNHTLLIIVIVSIFFYFLCIEKDVIDFSIYKYFLELKIV